MGKYIHKSKYFYGNKISDYGLEHGYVDYRTLALSFDAVLNNEILPKTQSVGYWESVGGEDYFYENDDGDRISVEEYNELTYEEQENYIENFYEIYQWYIISDGGADILQELTDELLYYNEELDMYVWAVTHWGTPWDYVLTDIRIQLDEDDE